MRKEDLVEEVSRVTETTFHEAKEVVEVILDSIVKALANGDRVELRGFGSFFTRRRRARRAQNPRTGESVEVPEKIIVAFRPSKDVKSLLQVPMGSARRQQ